MSLLSSQQRMLVHWIQVPSFRSGFAVFRALHECLCVMILCTDYMRIRFFCLSIDHADLNNYPVLF